MNPYSRPTPTYVHLGGGTMILCPECREIHEADAACPDTTQPKPWERVDYLRIARSVPRRVERPEDV